jgi:hypothetical protein
MLICRKTPNVVEIEEKCGKFTGRSKYVCGV